MAQPTPYYESDPSVNEQPYQPPPAFASPGVPIAPGYGYGYGIPSSYSYGTPPYENAINDGVVNYPVAPYSYGTPQQPPVPRYESYVDPNPYQQDIFQQQVIQPSPSQQYRRSRKSVPVQQERKQQSSMQLTRRRQQRIPGLTVNVKKVTVKTDSDPTTLLHKKTDQKQKSKQTTQQQTQTHRHKGTQQQSSTRKQQQTKTLQTKQIYQQDHRNRQIDLQNIKLSRWTFTTTSDPQFYLDGQKVMIIPEKALPRNHHLLQYRVPENYSDKAIVVRRHKGGKELLEIYYLNIYDPNGKRVFLRTDVIMPNHQ